MNTTSKRIKSMIADCRTDADLVGILRAHKIRYTYTTETGTLSVKIPCRKGAIRIYRTCSRSAPYMVTSVTPSPFVPAAIPVLHPDY